jgi:hypothetical protein
MAFLIVHYTILISSGQIRDIMDQMRFEKAIGAKVRM